jgi:RHS repeat-associated protein
LKVADSTVASEDRSYGYDAGWNLNKRTNNLTVYAFSVDNKNQLTNGTFGPFTYDDNGNVTFRASASWGFSYDAENQLGNWYYYDSSTNGNGQPTSAGDLRTEFVYDGRGRLRKRVEYTVSGFPYSWTVSTETRYVYDGMRVIQERNSGNTPTVSYTRGSDLSGALEGAGGIGGLLARSHGYSSGSWTNHNFYHADGNGNITYMVNSSQSVVASYRYDPFGNLVSAPSGSLASANVYRFSSKEIHLNSGMYYYGYRFYDPNLQRWLNRDPIEENGGINLYGYVANSPLDSIDLFGLQLWYCTTPTTTFFGIGRHGYVWNDDPNATEYGQRYCGQEGCSGSRPSGSGTENYGPRRGDSSSEPGYGYGDGGGWRGKNPDDGRNIECVPIDGTDDDAKNREFMQSCNSKIDKNPWIAPGIWDCHTSARKCLRQAGYTPPQFRRWNSRPPKVWVWPTVPPGTRPPVSLPPNYRSN